MQQEQSFLFGKDIGIQIEDMHDGLGYFICFPCTAQNYKQGMTASILTYKGNHTLMRQLLEDLIQSQRSQLKDLKFIKFTLSNGQILNNNRTVGWLKKLLANNEIDGLVLFVEEIEERFYKQSDNLVFKEAFGSQQPQRKYKMNVNFSIQNGKYVFSYEIYSYMSFEQLMRSFYTDFQNVFQNCRGMINRMNINNFRALQQANWEDWNDRTLQQLPFIADNTTICLVFQRGFQLKPKITHPQRKIIIYKQNSTSFIERYFEEVKFMTFKFLYQNQLRLNLEDKRTLRCLKANDTIVKENENLSKLQTFYLGNRQRQKFQLVGRVISHKMVFYRHLKNLFGNDADFPIYQYILSGKPNQSREIFLKRIKQSINKAISVRNINNQHLKIQKNFQKIYLYTLEQAHSFQREDQICLVNNQPVFKKTYPFYSIVNRKLRKTNIIDADDADISKSVVFRYTNSLIKQLSKIDRCIESLDVYRGQDVDQKCEIGDILMFKQFLSTSLDEQNTYQFFCKPRKYTPHKVLFKMTIRTGKPISQFSFYSQKEILLNPYTQFKVLNVTTKQIKFLGQAHKLKYIILQELEQSLSSAEEQRITRGNADITIDCDSLIEKYCKKQGECVCEVM